MSNIHACLIFNNFLKFKHSNNYRNYINKNHKSYLSNIYGSNLHYQIIRNLCSNASTDHLLKKHYDVIIVGGGVFGCSMLYHLVKENVTNIALIERAQLTSGTTWHTGGLVWRLRPNDTEIQLLNYARWLMKNLEKETGQPSGWEENGGVFIASNAERLKEYQRLQTLGKFFDVESYMLRPSELSDVHCLIDPSQVFGALYSPGDGGVDPNTYCNALVGWAKTRGAQVFENTSVKSILTAPNDEQQQLMTHSSSRIKGVRLLMNDGATATSKQSHDVTCDALVNACGVWAPDLANTCSSRGDHVITVPQTAFLHSYVVSEPIFEPGGLNLLPKFQPYAFGRHFPRNGTSAKITPLDKPVPNVRDHDRSVYIKLQGRQVLAFGGYEQNPVAVQTNGILFAQRNNSDTDEKKIEISTTKDHSEKSADGSLEKSADTLSQQPFHLFELDWTVFEPNLRASLELMPALKHTGIKSTVCGYESFTPDHKPLIGADINVGGYFHGSGFNSSGIMLSGGCAQQLAQLIARGSTTLDISHLDVRRFNKRYANNRRWILERSHEAYAKNYSIVFPYDEPLAGRNIRQSPLYKALLHRGCIYQERGGWERPGWFLALLYKTALFSQTQTNNTTDENIKDKTETTMGTSPSLLQQGDFPALAYDYYGAYPDLSTVHKHYPYARALEMDYTFEFPKHHTTVLRDECLACRQSVAIFDMSYFGKFYLAPTKQTKECYDKVSQLVDWLFCTRIPTTTYSRDKYKNLTLSTNNSNKIKPESLITKNTFYTCALNAHGGIEADLTVSVLFNENFNGQNTDITTSKLNNHNNKNSTKTESNINLDSKTKSKDLGNFQKQEHQHHHSIQLGCEPKDAMYYLAVGGGLAQHFETHVQRVITSLGFEPYVKLIDKTDEMGLISVQGPESRTVLQLLVSIDLSNKTFPPGSHATAMFSGDDLAGKPIPVRMVRVSFVGEMGWELHADAKDCVTIYEQIHSHAYKLGIPLRDAGYRALDSLSLEKGYYHWHSEIRTEDSPFEANLSFLCNKMKGGPHNNLNLDNDDMNKNSTDFLGKTALLTYRARDKMMKKLVFFALSENKVPLFGLETIWRNGTECCGFLRRAGYGYYMDKSIGLGYIYHPNYRPIDGVLTTQMNDSSNVKHSNNQENNINHQQQPMSIDEYIESALFYEIESFGKRYRAQYYKKSPFDTKNDRINGIYQ